MDYRLAQPPASKKPSNDEMDSELEKNKKKDIFFFLNLYLEMTGWNSYTKSQILERLEKLADDELYFDSLEPIRLKMAEGYEWEKGLAEDAARPGSVNYKR